jgi:L-fucose isomerase-like protein
LASSLLVRLGRRFKYLYRLPDDPEAGTELGRWLRAATTVRGLRRAVVAEVGNPPPGFYTSSVDALALMQKIGPRLTRVDLQTVLQKAAQVPAERYASVIEADRAAAKGLDALAPDQVIRSTQFLLALQDALGSPPPDAVSVRCWPELFTDYKAVACSTLSHLIDAGIPAACEADTLGAVTMLIQHRLTGQATYLGDLVHMDRGRNTCVFWHCGVGAYSLASPRTGPVAGVQPNRNLGFALNNALRSGPVTIARLGQAEGGFRMLVLKGEALDEPNRFWGTSVEVRLTRPVGEVLDAVIYGGYEHHYGLVWADVEPELREIGALLGLPVTTL